MGVRVARCGVRILDAGYSMLDQRGDKVNESIGSVEQKGQRSKAKGKGVRRRVQGRRLEL